MGIQWNLVPDWFFMTVSLAFGLVVGSFFNVLIYRMPRGESILHPPSYCPRCNDSIPWYLNIPVLAWLALRGKCRSCRLPISIEYPLVELLTALLSVACMYWMLFLDAEPSLPRALALFWLVLSCVPVFFIDIRHQLIPDTVPFGGIALGLAVAWLPESIGVVDSFLGLAVAGVGLWFFGFLMTRLLKKDALGFGDVKLLAMFGALLGLQLAFMSLVLGSMAGVLVTLPLKVILGEDKDVPLPFGPYLLLGSVLSFLWGKPLFDWYLSVAF